MSEETKTYLADAHRSMDPRQTIAIAKERLKLLDPNVFIGIQEIGQYDSMGVPVYRVDCNDRCNEWGKGASVEQCQASAIMERVERYSSLASSHNAISFLRSSFNDLRENAVSKKVFGITNLQRIFYGEDAIDSIPMDWVPVTNAGNGSRILVPAQTVYFRYPEKGFSDFKCTTGLASGNALHEAMHHALCEVIERHQFHIAHYNRPNAPRIDLTSIENVALKGLISHLETRGFVIIANNLSMGWKTPTISAFIFHPKERIIFAQYLHAGTASDPEIALIRAITEAAQTRAVLRFRGQGSAGHGFFESASPQIREEYRWVCAQETIPMHDVTNANAGSFVEEMKIAVEDVAQKGYQTFWHDLTNPILEIPVVRVLVPQLQPNFLLHGMGAFDKRSIVTPHLLIYDEVMRRCKDRHISNQKLDEIVPTP